MIIINNLSLSFGSQTLFKKLSCTIKGNERIGLVGRNGSGKSTLLKILARQHQPDTGTVTVIKDKTIAYLPQEVVLNSTKTVFDETFSSLKEITSITITYLMIWVKVKMTSVFLM